MIFGGLSLEDKPPWKILLRGAAIPGIVVTILALFGFYIGLTVKDFDPIKSAKIGAAFGFFYAFFGVLDFVLMILTSSEWDWSTRLYLVAGYVLIWAVTIYLIVQGLS